MKKLDQKKIPCVWVQWQEKQKREEFTWKKDEKLPRKQRINRKWNAFPTKTPVY